MNRGIKKALYKSLSAPEPIRRDEFISTLNYEETKQCVPFISQTKYIRKRFWILSFLIIAFIFITYKRFNINIEVVGVISAFTPLLVLLGIAEINKSKSNNMWELEASCRYNLSTLVLIRLTLIGIFHCILLFVVLAIFKDKSQYGLFRYVLYATTPFTLSAYSSFWIINHLKIKDSLYVCSGVTMLISILILIINVEFTQVYNLNYVWVWSVLSIVVFILLIKEIQNLTNERVVQWNFA